MSTEGTDKITDKPAEKPVEKNTDKITIDWNDLKTRKVDQRLREHEALERNRRQAELNPLTVQQENPSRGSIWYHPAILLAIFGLLGGLLAFAAGELLGVGPDLDVQAHQHMQDVQDLRDRSARGQIPTDRANRAIEAIRADSTDNPYFEIYSDQHSTPQQQLQRKAEVDHEQALKRIIANLLSFGVAGLLIAMCLSIAEPVVDRNWSKAGVNAVVGGTLGLVGGAVVSLFIERLYEMLVHRAAVLEDPASARMLASTVKWGVLGLFLTVAPGILMGNAKKLTIGLVGGLAGGLIGGLLFEPIFSATHNNDHISRLVALLAIGLCAGAATGLIENAAKGGWLKVTAGLIAGKQFILYRNPTFIGSGPECPIYLFKDPKVGKRHAAIHIVPGGFELENLPLGDTTLVNGRPIQRARLKAGDQLKVGATTFVFQEKKRQK